MRSRPGRTCTAAAALLAFGACGRAEPPATLPRLISPPAIAYPEDLWDAGVEDSTVLRVHIDTAGAVDSLAVHARSGYPAFDSAAVAGGRKLRFEPARRGSEAVAAWFQIPIRFRLTTPGSSSPAKP